MNHFVLIHKKIEELQKKKQKKNQENRFPDISSFCKYQTLIHQLCLEYIQRTGNMIFTLIHQSFVHLFKCISEKGTGILDRRKAFYNRFKIPKIIMH